MDDLVENAEDYGLESWQVDEIEKCASDFQYFCRNYVKITHPKRGLVPFNLYDYQKRMVAEYDRHRFNIISKFRQGGATTTTTIWSMWKCIFHPDQRIMIVSIGDREAIESGRYVKIAIENLPDWMRPQMGKNNDHEKEFADTNSVMWFLSPKAVRSKSLSVLVIDEAAFIQKMDDLWAAMMPTLSTGGSCIVISTVNGMGNWYHEYYTNAKDGRNIFNVIDIDYTEHPDYREPGWAPMMLAQLGEKRFAQEILRSFLGSGDTYIDAKLVAELDVKTRDDEPIRRVFPEWDGNKDTFKPDEIKKAEIALMTHEYVGGALWIWKEPEPNHEYILAADAAEGVGEGGDHSAFHVVDITNCEQVAEFYSDTVPPHIFSQVISQIGMYYNTALVVVENMGPGLSVLSRLQHNLYYDNLYYDKEEKAGLRIGPANRSIVLEAFQYAVCSSILKIHSRRLVHEIKTFNFNKAKKRAEAEKGKHDDLVIAIALAMFIRDEQVRRVPAGAEILSENINEQFETNIYEKIKKAILEEAPEDFLADLDKTKFKDELAVMPGVMFDIRRKHDSLLKEFGWIWLIITILSYGTLS